MFKHGFEKTAGIGSFLGGAARKVKKVITNPATPGKLMKAVSNPVSTAKGLARAAARTTSSAVGAVKKEVSDADKAFRGTNELHARINERGRREELHARINERRRREELHNSDIIDLANRVDDFQKAWNSFPLSKKPL